MQITMIAGGSRGDVQPYVALGKGLKQARHTVRVLANKDYQDLITEHGLEFFDMGGGVKAMAQGQIQEILEQGNLLKILSVTGQGAQQLALQSAANGLAACDGSDLILAGFAGLSTGLPLAEKLGIPFLQAHLMPFTPTREFPSVLTPQIPQSRMTTWANGMSHRLAQQMMWQMLRSADNKARSKVLGMKPAPFLGPFASLQREARPILYGYSPHVIPPPADWGEHIHITGYWFLEPSSGWEPPRDLMDFLRAGPPPVYVGFGSMLSRNPEETANLVLQALDLAGVRGVLSSGWGGLKKENLPETVFMIGSIPHFWLFPRMAAIVHHGGAGTTGAALRAGVPSIITPFFGDQPFWGRRVYDLGVGPRPIPRRRLTARNLAEAIQRAVTDTEMREKASALGERIRAEDGVAQAVKIIGRFGDSKDLQG
ncbi:glycosyltransferase family 1 protein [Chloroflexi bacterium CFX6]|nr:glycosyltransferase family 1 protein [Chloroflexi bacterium CFX6]